MEMSIREAKARFSEAIAAVERGESVIVTKYGRPVAELSQPKPRKKLDFAAADAFLKERGWTNRKGLWPAEFDDPAFSREVLGLDD
jgi:prevent-host-death family protein